MTLKKGTYLFKKGDSLKGLYILINGAVSEIYFQKNIERSPSKENNEDFEIKKNSESILLEENTNDLVKYIA